MARYEHLPIFRRMMELAVYMEQVVRHFPRYHKYTLGSELRSMCHEALALIMEANSARDKLPVLLRLRVRLERIKIHLMLAKEVNAFNRARSFYHASEMAVSVSKQNEGWIRSCGAR